MFAIRGMVYISHYDPTTETFTFVDEDLELRPLYDEASRIKHIADAWIKNLKKKTQP
jgi:hypothetical protein